MAKISVKDIGKKYKTYPSQGRRLLEIASAGLVKTHVENWVLQGITFDVSAGESIALVGQNGSGKSTLLKIIVGSTKQSKGSVELSGSISALLELGMGFHPEFDGINNSIMGLQILGVKGDDIQKLIPEIIEFSELGDYFHRPMRTYSSGMQVRLAFSVATAIRPDILIIDEALSVGDIYFQHKSMRRIRTLREEGTTLLFVSHDATAVKTLCDRAILLDQGTIIREGTPDQVMDYYNALIARKEQDLDIRQEESVSGRKITRSGSKLAEFNQVMILDDQGVQRDTLQVGAEVTIRCSLRILAAMESPTIGIAIRDRLGNEVFGTNTFHLQRPKKELESGTEMDVDFKLTLNLGVGSYSITAAAHTTDTHLQDNYDWWDLACVFQVVPGSEFRFQGVNYLPVEVIENFSEVEV